MGKTSKVMPLCCASTNTTHGIYFLRKSSENIVFQSTASSRSGGTAKKEATTTRSVAGGGTVALPSLLLDFSYPSLPLLTTGATMKRTMRSTSKSLSKEGSPRSATKSASGKKADGAGEGSAKGSAITSARGSPRESARKGDEGGEKESGRKVVLTSRSGKVSARGSPKVSARGSPKVSARDSPKASARGSPKVSARSTNEETQAPEGTTSDKGSPGEVSEADLKKFFDWASDRKGTPHLHTYNSNPCPYRVRPLFLVVFEDPLVRERDETEVRRIMDIAGGAAALMKELKVPHSLLNARLAQSVASLFSYTSLDFARGY